MMRTSIYYAVICVCVQSCLMACDRMECAEEQQRAAGMVFRLEEKVMGQGLSKASEAAPIDSCGFLVTALADGNVIFNGTVLKVGDGDVYAPVGRISGAVCFPSTYPRMDVFACFPPDLDMACSGDEVSIPYCHDGHSDLLAAEAASVSFAEGGVCLAFRHILSAATVSCRSTCTDAVVNVRSVCLCVPASGTFSFLGWDWETEDALEMEEYVVTSFAAGDSDRALGTRTVIPGIYDLMVEWTVSYGDGRAVEFSRNVAQVAFIAGEETVVNLAFEGKTNEKLSFNITVNKWNTNTVDTVLD